MLLSRKRVALLCLALFAIAAMASFVIAMPAVLVELGVALLAIVVCAARVPNESLHARPALVALRASHHLPRASILPAVR